MLWGTRKINQNQTKSRIFGEKSQKTELIRTRTWFLDYKQPKMAKRIYSNSQKMKEKTLKDQKNKKQSLKLELQNLKLKEKEKKNQHSV